MATTGMLTTIPNLILLRSPASRLNSQQSKMGSSNERNQSVSVPIRLLVNVMI